MDARRAGAVTAATGAVLAGVLGLLVRRNGGDPVTLDAVLGALSGSSFALTGAVVALRSPRHPVGWLLVLIGACSAIGDLADAVARTGSGGVVTWSAWLSSWIWFPVLGLLPTVVLALYPTGRAGSLPRRLLVTAGAVGTACMCLAFALVRDAADDVVAGVQNPLEVHGLGIALAVAGGALLVPTVALTVVDAGRRTWLASGDERMQLVWLLTAVLVTVAASYTPWETVRAAFFVVVPVAIGVGVLRYRLLGLQPVLRRALLYSGLTVAVVVVFVAVTAALSPAVDGGPVPTATAAALVAMGLTPVRDRLQRGVDRLVYGERRDPVRAVATLGRDVARSAAVPQVLTTVAQALRSPHVLLRDPAGEVLAETGAPSPGAPLVVPLRVGGHPVGELVVAARTPRDGWAAADRSLLEVLAPQVAVVQHAAQLAAEVLVSRDRAVAAGADERQRLRAELHDGLGPALTGIALGVEAAQAAAPVDPARAASLLARLAQETHAAAAEVRRLVEGLRPAALEQTELTQAVTRLLDGIASQSPVDVDLQVDPPLPPLPPDVDAAAYRIVGEAVTNVVRHSGARRCAVRLWVDGDALQVEVRDDGSGLPAQPRDGVGLVSMRRRAVELGGTWEAGPHDAGGTTVRVSLPLRTAVPA